MKEEGDRRLAEALAINSSLTDLDLSWNRVKDERAGRLAEALASNSTLSSLDLSANRVIEEGARRLADALSTNYGLTEVNFTGIGIPDVLWTLIIPCSQEQGYSPQYLASGRRPHNASVAMLMCLLVMQVELANACQQGGLASVDRLISEAEAQGAETLEELWISQDRKREQRR